MCSEQCLLCDKLQVVKINYAGYHGLCESHLTNSLQLLECTKCNSNVKLLLHQDIRNQCNFCNIKSNCSRHSCGKNICSNCINFSGECPECNPVNNCFEKDTLILYSARRVKSNRVSHQSLLSDDQAQLYLKLKVTHDSKVKDAISTICNNEVTNTDSRPSIIRSCAYKEGLGYHHILHIKNLCENSVNPPIEIIQAPASLNPIMMSINPPEEYIQQERRSNSSNRFKDFFANFLSCRFFG